MRNWIILAGLLVCGTLLVAQKPSLAQNPSSDHKTSSTQKPSDSSASDSTAVPPAADFSGMYSFLQEGEFVQVSVEDDGRVTGFISRYGDAASDHGVFLNQFFKQGKIDGSKLTFTTETVHGVWYEFKGTVERGSGKNPGDESYYLLKGTLTERRTDADKKISSKANEVVLKSFPEDLEAAPPERE